MLGKYASADQFLQGIGLNPDTNPAAGYIPFNDTDAMIGTNHSDVLPQLQSSKAILDPGGLPTNLTKTKVANIMKLTDDVTNGFDLLYYSTLTFGTPPQSLTVSIDTGSADLWVPANCRACDNAQYTPKASSTYKKNSSKFSISYVSLLSRWLLCRAFR